MSVTEDTIRKISEDASDRFDFWATFISAIQARTMAEIGVQRGEFAGRILDGCSAIERYYMVDPWRHLDDWRKPANKSDGTFEQYYQDSMERTEAHRDKRVVLRGRTVEVSDQIDDAELDFAYVDGDHTLRGVSVDLIRIWPKIRPGGWIGGDDFTRNVLQHGPGFEPTLVFPFAIYFAEAVGARIFGVGRRQFVLEKSRDHEHAFIDITGSYPEPVLKRQIDRAIRKGKS